MLLTITSTHYPATDLGYLLHKNPARVQSLDIAYGQAHVFYPEATPERCTAALLLDIDPIALVRNHYGPAGAGFALEQYVNDRPYAATSLLSTALAKAFSTALNGTSKDRPELAAMALPWTVVLTAVPAHGPEAIERLFAPLGYDLTIESFPLDPTQPAWGASRYHNLTLRHAALRLHEVLAHIYVLIPVLDNDKHYWISRDEVDKLLAKGGEWLPAHPAREFITRRYLGNFAALVQPALAQLLAAEGTPTETETPEEALITDAPESAETPPEKVKLHDQRLLRVAELIRLSGARRVLDLGCGEGKLLRILLRQKQIELLRGMDVSTRALARAADRLHVTELAPSLREKLDLIQGSLLYRDARLAGFDAAAVVEVIEHLDEARLAAFERVLFAEARPTHVFLTTPNADYNAQYETLSAGEFRHSDHRFEWTRAQFEAWAAGVAERHGYTVACEPLGPLAEGFGAPSQLAAFSRLGASVLTSSSV
jgi:3' terminal RNA ribose 2'-O-methyltransferase Hen1